MLHEGIRELQANLSKEAIICIYTLIEIGRDCYFSESYDSLYSKFMRLAEDEYEFGVNCSYIFTNCIAFTLIEKALAKSGQISLLKKMK
ncbi:MAG: hypothetical protein U5J62_06740 [Desulfurivibrio sp.]|nr:hypothetical protein [Desulfurivibrio sp.]